VARPNVRWSVDFEHDQLSNRRRFRILNVIDDVTKECLAAAADTSIFRPEGGARARRHHRLARQPDLIISDHGTEFTSNAILAWAQSSRTAWHSLRQENRCRTGSARRSTTAA
jgi:transposase InsO family protein